MTNKTQSKLLIVIFLPLIFLVQSFSLMELLERYGNLDFFGRKEHKLRPVKQALPYHSWEKLFQIFFITMRIITGKARIIKPAIKIQIQTGTSRIAKYAGPPPLSAEALKKREQAEKILQEFLGTP